MNREKKVFISALVLFLYLSFAGSDLAGSQAVAFQFIRIGRDPDAIKLLRDLDDHPKVGKHIDCLPGT